jgi:hypothetical protein
MPVFDRSQRVLPITVNVPVTDGVPAPVNLPTPVPAPVQQPVEPPIDANKLADAIRPPTPKQQRSFVLPYPIA